MLLTRTSPDGVATNILAGNFDMSQHWRINPEYQTYERDAAEVNIVGSITWGGEAAVIILSGAGQKWLTPSSGERMVAGTKWILGMRRSALKSTPAKRPSKYLSRQTL